MKLHQLRALLAIAKHGSIHEAARSMPISQPALSKSLIELEKELGVALMSRTVRGAQLTPYGIALAKRATVIEREVQHAKEDIAAIRGQLNGQLNIGFTAVASAGALPHAINAFRRRCPDVALCATELRQQQILEGLREGRLDVGLVATNGSPGTNAFKWEKLFTIGMSIAVSAGHPLAGATTVRELTDADWLVLDSLEDSDSPLPTLMRMHRLPMPVRVVQCLSNLLAMRLAIEGDFVSVWSDRVFHSTSVLRVGQGQLIRLEIKDEVPEFHVYLVYRSEDLMTRVCSEFMKDLRAYRGTSG